MKKRKILFSVMTCFAINAHACFMNNMSGQTEYDIDPTKSNGPIRKAPARKSIIVSVTNQQNLELVHTYGRTPFTYYIYDEKGCPVMSGSGEFDDNGLSHVTIDTLPSDYYTIEVVVNGSTHLCSFYKM